MGVGRSVTTLPRAGRCQALTIGSLGCHAIGARVRMPGGISKEYSMRFITSLTAATTGALLLSAVLSFAAEPAALINPTPGGAGAAGAGAAPAPTTQPALTKDS